MAGWTGLEPAAFCVTGRRSNQLSYHPEGERRANVEREGGKSSVFEPGPEGESGPVLLVGSARFRANLAVLLLNENRHRPAAVSQSESSSADRPTKPSPG